VLCLPERKHQFGEPNPVSGSILDDGEKLSL
jgi:hypothetical protein